MTLDPRRYLTAWAIMAGLLVALASTAAGERLALALAFLALFGTATLALGLRAEGGSPS